MSRRMTNIQRLGLLLTGILMLMAGLAMWKCGSAECEVAECESVECGGVECDSVEVEECESAKCESEEYEVGARDFLNEVISDN